ncbi:MAG TPA: cation:proton antiporter [Patescibacteria group bacterium]|nr:cation:proton antiporter [Patescibacteria group bacterium]
MHSVFTELSIVIVFSALVSLILRLIRQPMIIGHIFTGILVGPIAFHIIKSPDTFEVFGQFGIALLLLIVGIGLNPRVIKEVGRIATLIAFSKVIITTSIGFAVSRLLGFNQITSLYIGVGLSFSSTIIILKLLTDKKEQNRLYGKISVGFLLVEDLIATLVLVGVAATGTGGLSINDVTGLILKAGLIIGGVLIVRSFVLPSLKGIIAGSQEFLFIFAIAWSLGLATLFDRLGFSLEIGALLAGVTLASQPYAQEISSRLKPLRDFFIVLFFISLGSHLQLQNLSAVLPKAILFSGIVLIANPLIVMSVMGLSGYTKKSSFKVGIAGAQISEFSFILLLLANQLGQIGEETVTLVTLAALITIAVSTYVIIYSDRIYNSAEKYLHMFERQKVRAEHESSPHYDLVLIGYQKGGPEFLKVFKQLHHSYTVIDYDPAVIDTLEHNDINYLYGDVTDPELLEEIDLERSKLIVSNLSDLEINQFLLNWLETHNPSAVFICTADTIEHAADLYSLGAAYVMLPHYIGSEKIGAFIKKSGLKKSEFKKYREKHLAYLQSHYSVYAEAS